MFDSPTRYCEEIVAATIPFWNIGSNIAFVLAGLLVLWHLKSRQRNGRFWLKLLPWSLVAVGVASSIWHAGGSLFGDFVDTASIGITVAIVYFSIWEKSGQRRVLVALLFISIASVTFFLERLEVYNGGIVYVFLVFALLASFLAATKKSMRSTLIAALSTASFLVALYFRYVDPHVCGTFPIGTHFLWHVVAAVGFFLMYIAISIRDQVHDLPVGPRNCERNGGSSP